jgi:hypothetical protein
VLPFDDSGSGPDRGAELLGIKAEPPTRLAENLVKSLVEDTGGLICQLALLHQ